MAEGPIFVVGCQRSGTTALTVMLDRHPAIASLPETQYYYRFEPRLRERAKGLDRGQLVAEALGDPDIAMAKLDRDEVLSAFTARPQTLDGLFLALLDAQLARSERQRACEKSCHHLFVAPRLLALDPRAKVLCIVRDGRDVVDSLTRTSWARHFPEVVDAWQWNDFAHAARRFAASLPEGRFQIVRFEDLMLESEPTLRRVMAFLGEDFVADQLMDSSDSAAVPDVERGWKQKATASPDAHRVEAWRRWEDHDRIRRLSWWMRAGLADNGYDLGPAKASVGERIGWELRYLPLRRPIVGISRWLWRMMPTSRRNA